MKIVYIILLILFFGITIMVKAQKVFLKAQNSGWYPPFLSPVIDTILSDSGSGKILDIGTGPGKLLELLIQKDSSLQLTGIDIDKAMIDLARERVLHPNVRFQYEKENENLEFRDGEFDVVTFCSVLFLLDDSVRTILMNEALRVLKPGGKIIVLTPSGEKSIASSYFEVWDYPSNKYNWTFVVWKTFTTRTARKWQNQKWLSNFTMKHCLEYQTNMVFNNNATIEIVSKSINF
jgi:ubiquinone/menaquinone biosynthesis C-methylase UbiE